MPYYNKFDIVEAHYWFCVDHHEGQSSDKYLRMCKLSEFFTPSGLSNGPTNENSGAIYDALCDKEGCEHLKDES